MGWPEHFHISDTSRQLIIDRSQVYALDNNQIVQIGYAYARDYFDISRRHSDKQIVLFSIKGQGIVTTPEHHHVMTSNTIIYLPAGQPHRILLDSPQWECCWIVLEPESDWTAKLPRDTQFKDSANAELVRHIIDCIHHSLHAGYPITDQLTGLQVEQLRVLATHRLPSTMTHSQIRLQNVFRRVQQQLHRDWSVSDLAKLHPCSEPHFHRLCQTYFGHSPIAQLTKQRMEQASQMLLNSDVPIQHICESVGYPNPANFSTRFKKWSTFTPREYRARFS